jgi:hypothetical protein
LVAGVGVAAPVIAALALIVKLVIVVGLPLVAERLAASLIHRAAPPDLRQVPIASGSARLLGLTLGVILVYDRYGGPGFEVPGLFVRGGPWDLSLWEFLAWRANPFDYGIGTLAAYFSHHDPGTTAPVGLLLAALTLATAATPFAMWPRPVAARAALFNLATAVLATYLTIYVVVLLFWLLYLLNFWTFALLVAIFQYYRSRTSHAR